MRSFERFILELLATSVNASRTTTVPLEQLNDDDWTAFLKLAQSQGVGSIVADCIQNLPADAKPPKQVQMVLAVHKIRQEKRYKWQLETANELAQSLKDQGVQMMVLKGISFSTYYNKPPLRESGDCDIYLGDHFELAHKIINRIGGSYDEGTYKHSHLYLKGLLIENHRYITDFHGTKKGIALECLLQKYAKYPADRIEGTDLVRPNVHFNALHLLRHAQGNLMLGGMTLRMIYDWTALLKSEQDRIDFDQLYKDLETFNLRKFAEVLTAISVTYFGLKLTNPNIAICNDENAVASIIIDVFRNGNHLIPNESFVHKAKRIFARFKRMWRMRDFAIESVPMMIWNSFAFSSYLKRDIRIKPAEVLQQ